MVVLVSSLHTYSGLRHFASSRHLLLPLPAEVLTWCQEQGCTCSGCSAMRYCATALLRYWVTGLLRYCDTSLMRYCAIALLRYLLIRYCAPALVHTLLVCLYSAGVGDDLSHFEPPLHLAIKRDRLGWCQST